MIARELQVNTLYIFYRSAEFATFNLKSVSHSHLYLILYARIITANSSVMPFAIIMGKLVLNNPYKSQSNVPKVKRPYIESDIPVVFFV